MGSALFDRKKQRQEEEEELQREKEELIRKEAEEKEKRKKEAEKEEEERKKEKEKKLKEEEEAKEKNKQDDDEKGKTDGKVCLRVTFTIFFKDIASTLQINATMTNFIKKERNYLFFYLDHIQFKLSFAFI